jgi:hypothetical protein
MLHYQLLVNDSHFISIRMGFALEQSDFILLKNKAHKIFCTINGLIKAFAIKPHHLMVLLRIP